MSKYRHQTTHFTTALKQGGKIGQFQHISLMMFVSYFEDARIAFLVES